MAKVVVAAIPRQLAALAARTIRIAANPNTENLVSRAKIPTVYVVELQHTHVYAVNRPSKALACVVLQKAAVFANADYRN